MLRTRAGTRTEGLGGGYGAKKGHHGTGAARQVPNRFLFGPDRCTPRTLLSQHRKPPVTEIFYMTP